MGLVLTEDGNLSSPYLNLSCSFLAPSNVVFLGTMERKYVYKCFLLPDTFNLLLILYRNSRSNTL